MAPHGLDRAGGWVSISAYEVHYITETMTLYRRHTKAGIHTPIMAAIFHLGDRLLLYIVPLAGRCTAYSPPFNC